MGRIHDGEVWLDGSGARVLVERLAGDEELRKMLQNFAAERVGLGGVPLLRLRLLKDPAKGEAAAVLQRLPARWGLALERCDESDGATRLTVRSQNIVMSFEERGLRGLVQLADALAEEVIAADPLDEATFAEAQAALEEIGIEVENNEPLYPLLDRLKFYARDLETVKTLEQLLKKQGLELGRWGKRGEWLEREWLSLPGLYAEEALGIDFGKLEEERRQLLEEVSKP